MISPHWQLVDLDPVTWRNIGRYINPGLYIRGSDPDERALYILHDGGKVLNIVDTESGRRTDLGITAIKDPDELAVELHQRGEWARVHVVDRQHLAAVSHEAQSDPRHGLTLDAYYRLVNHLIWSSSDSRYVIHPPRTSTWHGWSYDIVQAWLSSLPDPATVALGVVGDSGLEIGLIAQAEGGLVTLITTFEALPIPRDEASVSADYLDRLWSAIDVRFAPPQAILLCSPEVFHAWIHDPDKGRTISNAIGNGTAYVRTQLVDDQFL